MWIRDYNTFIELSAEVFEPEVLKEYLLVFFRMQGDDGNMTLYPPYPEGSFKNKSMVPYGYQIGGD